MRFVFCLLAVLTLRPVAAQVLQDETTANFAHQVKQIDEFIERFNNQDNTLIKNYLKKQDPNIRITRQGLIRGLFNASDTSWRKDEILRFIGQVTDTIQPVFLNFFDQNWYAEVNCAVTHRGKPKNMTVILRIQREKNGMSKWVAVSAIADFMRLPVRRDTTTGLNPLSHATDFMNIDLLATDKKNIRNYLPNQRWDDILSVFLYETQSNQLSIRQVNKITYHFMQVEGWVFTVNRFSRQTRNSGWLVSRLMPANATAKRQYAREKLNLPDDLLGFGTPD
ncbi:MAG: hypothetical protein MUD08_02095 [Cytophagales bacterium]|nr:hypothetical protein [Cytophagales bacterium]